MALHKDIERKIEHGHHAWGMVPVLFFLSNMVPSIPEIHTISFSVFSGFLAYTNTKL